MTSFLSGPFIASSPRPARAAARRSSPSPYLSAGSEPSSAPLREGRRHPSPRRRRVQRLSGRRRPLLSYIDLTEHRWQSITMTKRSHMTVLDDLPEWIVIEEILVRLAPKDVLRCRAVRKM
ncbi:hypothetical protein ZWY2020_001477 [Hordeum vulgare]|nr:hypothetical protein ZWY2020_001477 [Hordeum vulgare]